MQPELATTPDRTLTGRGRRLATRLRLPTTLLKFLIIDGIGFVVRKANRPGLERPGVDAEAVNAGQGQAENEPRQHQGDQHRGCGR
jgi:hypothetical protein